MFKTPWFALTLCLLLAPSALAHGFVYVTNYGDGTISQYRANLNGTLTPLNPPTVKAYPRCHSLAIARGRFLYALSALHWSQRNCLLSQFRIRPNGTLARLSPPTVPLSPMSDDSPILVTVEPNGRFVYVANGGGSIAGFRIQRHGTLVPLGPSSAKTPSEGGDDCHVSYDRRHGLVYVSMYGHMMIEVFGGTQAFRILPNGHLRLMPKSSTREIVEGINVTHNGRFAYIPSHYRDLEYHNAEAPKVVVSQYRTVSDGILHPLAPAQIASPLRPTQVGLPLTEKMILIHPQDRFCYLFSPNGYWVDAGTYNRRLVGSLSIAHYAIRPSGLLGRPAWQTFNLKADVWDAATDPLGRFLYLLTDNGVRPFRIRPDGSVTSLSPRSIRAGHGPLGVVCVQR